MDKKTKFIETVINEISPYLLLDFNNEEKNEALQIYSKKLSARYDFLESMELVDKYPFDEFVRRVLSGEIPQIQKMTTVERKKIYLSDIKLEEIYRLSSNAYGLAQDYINQNSIVSNEEVEMILHQIQELLKEVKPHNKETAKQLISEATLDLIYASGQTEATSFRLASYIRDQQDKTITEEQRDPK